MEGTEEAGDSKHAILSLKFVKRRKMKMGRCMVESGLRKMLEMSV